MILKKRGDFYLAKPINESRSWRETDRYVRKNYQFNMKLMAHDIRRRLWESESLRVWTVSDTYVQYISYRHITFWFDESNLMHNGNLTEFQRRKGKKEKEKKKTYIAMQFTKKNESPISCSIRNAHLIPTKTLLFSFYGSSDWKRNK